MENNKLIAEFMGYEVKHNKCYSPKYNDGTIAPMQFHTSWDWLMPVVHKCYQEHTCSQERMNSNDAYEIKTCDITRVYKAVVEFIKEQNTIVIGSFDENGNLI